MFTEDLKPGDKVLISNTRGRVRAGTVERLTKTLVIVNGAQFRKSDGYEPGPGHYKATICPFCQVRLDAQVREDTRVRTSNDLRATDWRRLPGDKLARIAAILTEDTP